MFALDSLRSEEFNWRCALSLAMASELVYQPQEAVISLAKNVWGFSRCVFLDEAETQGFVAHSDDVVLVAFRGTESVGDWLGNIDIRSTERPYGRVHSGFYRAFRVVEDALRQELTFAQPRPRRFWITGHSLGGALATISAAELPVDAGITGCYTFGQPRIGGRSLQRTIDDRYPQRFFRFVNDDDLVTRVPPGFRHVGTLLHLDSDGQLIGGGAESAPEDAAGETTSEPPPLGEVEFREMQAEIRSVQASAATIVLENPALEREELVDRTIEGLFPSARDHGLNRYIAAIRRHVQAEESPQSAARVIDAALEVAQGVRRGTLAIEKASLPRFFGGNETDLLPVLVRVADSSWTAPPGIRVNSRIGTICSMQATADQIEHLKLDSSVLSIQGSREGGLPECAVSVPFVGGTTVHGPPIDERGDSALIGLIDTGVDVLHGAFRDAAGHSRILMLWNQFDDTGPTPHAVDPVHFQPDYGTLYQTAAIDAFLVGPVAAVPSALRDPEGHGTHVASIAAGRQVGTFGGGMAPEARLAVVIPSMKTAPGAPPSLGYSNSHVDALSFLKAVAGREGLPMAINVSLGMNAGAHDGTSNLEAAFDGITGGGRDAGLVVVKSAGNERGFGGHAQIQAFVGVQTIEWESLDVFRLQDYIEVWFSSLDELEFKLSDPAGATSNPVSIAARQTTADLGGNLCRLQLTPLHGDNGESQLTIQIFPQSKPIQAGPWSLEIVGQRVGSADGRVDAWVERQGARAVRFTTGDNDAMILSIPGTANTVITVAACHAADPLKLTDSSSYGPTRDGKPKPDLCAPGFQITAAGSNSPHQQAVHTETGTSMAAPHVTGTLALALSRRHKQPGHTQWNARQLQRALIKSARSQSRIHHPGFGFGVLDATAFLKELG